MRKPSRQTCSKKLHGKCVLCGEDNYDLLNAHRILYGEHGGKYVPENILVVCVKCHRLIHIGQIVIDRKYKNTGKSLYVLHCWISGEEKWIPCS